MAETKLYVILGSHACRTGILLMEHKGIEYQQVVLPTGMHPFALRAAGFDRNRQPVRTLGGERPAMLATADRNGTVPSLCMDGQRVKTNRAIARFLDSQLPEPPLFPADPARRAAVEEAERWGDEVLQPVPRRLTWWAIKRDRPAGRSFLEGARLGIPVGLAARTARPIIWMSARLNEANDDAV